MIDLDHFCNVNGYPVERGVWLRRGSIVEMRRRSKLREKLKIDGGKDI